MELEWEHSGQYGRFAWCLCELAPFFYLKTKANIGSYYFLPELETEILLKCMV